MRLRGRRTQALKGENNRPAVLLCRESWLKAGAALVTVATLFAPASLRAEPKTVAEIANYLAPDRQQILEAGARREGALMVYTTGVEAPVLIKAFQEKYPYIHVETGQGGSSDTTRKVIEEYNAGTYNVDAFELGTFGLLIPRDQRILQPFLSPEEASYSADAIEANHYWASVRQTYTGLAYNTEKVAAADAPKTYADLLDPKWKGRLAISGSDTTPVNWVGAMALSEGEDFVRRLGQQSIRVYSVSARAVTNLMISGEVELSPTVYLAHAESSRKAGAPLQWAALGPVPVLDTATAVAAKAPHPHAAMLFIDFLLSKQGQLLYRGIGYSSSRKDMPSTDLPMVEKKIFMATRPDYTAEYETWANLYREVFLKGAAPSKSQP
ncbi:MAG TPA: extracellular solute-binding protein [Beijerinckiaceae bacterium]|nr:extracellular solute-binding protein [Beijerinckiaceae bacterium]